MNPVPGAAAPAVVRFHYLIPIESAPQAATNVAKILLKLECDGAVAGAWPADGFGYSGSEENGDGFGTQVLCSGTPHPPCAQ